MGLFDNTCRPSKNDPAVRVLSLSLPHPRPPPTRDQKKNHPQPTQNAPPSNFLITGELPQGQIPWTVPIHESSAVDPCKGFTPRTRNRPRVNTLKNAHLNPSRHRTCTTTVPCPTRMWLTSSESPAPTKGHLQQNEQEQHSHTKRNRDACPAQWARTIRSLTPVRGLTHPSIPPPFHWLEKNARRHLPKNHGIFFFLGIRIRERVVKAKKVRTTSDDSGGKSVSENQGSLL